MMTVKTCALLAIVAAPAAYALSTAPVSGDLTFYGGAGKGGQCTMDPSFTPPGYTTVAMNDEQFANGAACGNCLEACYDITSYSTGEVTDTICFDAIVDNRCPECKYGDLDRGIDGDGRWDVTWNYKECPTSGLSFETQGSNAWYGKLKILGGPSAVEAVTCEDRVWSPTPDGFWVGNDGNGGLCRGVTCEVEFVMGGTDSVTVPGELFGGSSC